MSECLPFAINAHSVAVSLSIANHHASLPIAWRLYLPEDWNNDAERRKKAGVPADVVFKTKPQIALEQITRTCEAGIARGVVLMDAGYGADTDLRDDITALGLTYAAGIGPNTSVWAPGTAPLPPKPWSGQADDAAAPRCRTSARANVYRERQALTRRQGSGAEPP